MRAERRVILLAAALACSSALAQKPGTPDSTKAAAATPATNPAFTPQNADGRPAKPASDSKDKPGGKKSKGPTDITGLKVTFDQRANVAVFTDSVVVINPDFKVYCDKLTMHLKHEEKDARGANPAGGKTPPNADTDGAAKGKGGAFEKAIAEATSGHRVKITQDKKDAEDHIETPDYTVGLAEKATYDAATKETVLTGNPNVTQGANHCIATDPSTVMILNADGHMRTVGPHRSILVEQADPAKHGVSPPAKKTKGPTDITALESTFDQKANLAVFTGSVVVKDPDFNVLCDTLTAHLRHEEKTGEDAHSAADRTPPKTAAAKQGDSGATPKRGGGLEKAVAVTTSQRQVVITQDKKDTAGNIVARNFSVGHADKATYDGASGNITLTGNPDLTQGTDRCIATDPSTTMILNPDGHFTAVGPHRMALVEQAETLFSGSELKVAKAAGRSGVIVSAVLVKLGVAQSAAPGVTAYMGTDFKVTKRLEGKCDEAISVKIVVLNHDPIHELTPEVGSEYILFLGSEVGQEQVVIKLIPSNEQTLNAVTVALAAIH